MEFFGSKIPKLIFFKKYDIINIEKGDNDMNENYNFLDMLTIVGFIAQIENIQKDEEYSKYIKSVIRSISIEIDKLHRENDIIMEQNKKIIALLERR